MMMLESDARISEKTLSPIPTGVAASPILTNTGNERFNNRAKWQTVIDDTLVEWGRDPSRFAEDGLAPPSAKAIGAACQIALFLRDYDYDAPLRVVPNGDGGIVFERSQGEIFETIEIQEDGSYEWATFNNGRLRSHTLVLNRQTARC
ncbi:MAG: hypothetical protein ACYC3I_01780 [Gemmataceae bacterium]